MEVRRDPRSFFFFIILLLLLNSSDPGGQQPFTPRNVYSELLQREWDQLDILNRTRYGDFDAGKNKWLNITGLRDQDGFDWYLLDRVRQHALEQTRRLLGSTAEVALDGNIDHGKAVPVYRNISGYVEGEWVRSPLGHVRHPGDVNASTIFLPDGSSFTANEFERNLTGTGGMVRLHFTELEGRMRVDENKTVSEVSARVIIGDNGSTGGNWWEFVLNGVHFPKFGGIVLTTTSERYSGIFALPHLQLSQHLYSTSQHLLNSTIHDTIERQINRVYPVWNPWTSAVDGANDAVMGTPHCEFVLFLQQHPRFPANLEQHDGSTAFNIDWLENELRYPTGAPLPRLSPMSMSMVGFSPDCGFVIESKGPTDQSLSEYADLKGSKTEEFNTRAKHSVIAFTVTLCLQVMFLVKQMKETATPSTRNRVSFYTIAMLATGDGFGFLSFIFLHLFVGTAQLPLYATAFMALFSVVFELRFLMDIWTVQATEQMRLDRQQASTTTSSEPQPPDTTNTPAPPVSPPGGGLPLPATAARPGTATPIILAPDQDDAADNAATPTPARDAATTTGTTPARAELGALYSRYCLLLVAIFFLTLQFTAVRSTARAFYFNTLCFVYLSFWCPQIYRNIMRNCRKALRWDFVLGQSAVRLAPIAYFYAVSDNVLFAKTDMKALMVLVGWVWIQILALASQEILGSRFFIREGWAPPAYDYHPILREDEEGATMPIGLSSASSFGGTPSSPSTSTKAGAESKASKGKKIFDCSICAQDIEVPVIPSEGSGESAAAGLSGTLVLQRRAYMVTPCRHIFHTPCLEGWMRYRLQCPNCREILPPL